MPLLPQDPEQRQKLLLAVLLAGGLGYVGLQYVYRPEAQEMAAMEQRLEQLQTRNRSARTLVQAEGQAEVERRLARYSDQLQRVEALIPSSEELPDLLDAISAEARRTEVELSLIQPTGAVQEAYYTRRTYDLAVIGSYHQVAAFLTRVASLPRIVTPTHLHLGPLGEAEADAAPRLEARFSVETYVLPAAAPPVEPDDVS